MRDCEGRETISCNGIVGSLDEPSVVHLLFPITEWVLELDIKAASPVAKLINSADLNVLISSEQIVSEAGSNKSVVSSETVVELLANRVEREASSATCAR